MDSPEKELTSLVPSSVFARNRKSSRHSYAEEPVVRGPINSAVIDLSTSPTQSQKRLSFDEEHSVQRETSPTEEELEVLRRKGLAAARDKRVHGNGKGKQPVYETEVVEEESDDEGQDLCVICLQAVRDPTIVGECGHKIFCFECINVWANQSRQCPLCVRSMSPFLLHELDSPVGPTKVSSLSSSSSSNHPAESRITASVSPRSSTYHHYQPSVQTPSRKPPSLPLHPPQFTGTSATTTTPSDTTALENSYTATAMACEVVGKTCGRV
ncbi:hypothetical protein QFC24_004551 [Naganishia onofrii]|uniref:Uncharacterized protein n=1 Tax=Naganishia onofrii TaxID=1851511 RepID=A0ACC2XEA9_9TREE|nr:hypothetical protein QFC24_004551 [Naganishia onofrii]